jgi:nucleotide-binding universal stress UspA family protein
MSAPQLFSKILWASEGRRDEHHAVRWVHELCDRYCCELWIVHVVPAIPAEPVPELELHGGEERAIAGLKARTRALRWRGVEASLHVIRGVVGSPAPAIAQVAAAVDADLIVLQAHERHPVDSIGTVVRLLASSPCPLLVFRGEGARPVIGDQSRTAGRSDKVPLLHD